jgi:hypothetical protein
MKSTCWKKKLLLQIISSAAFGTLSPFGIPNTRNPYKLQKMMGHSSLTVTLTYLRNLGLVVNADSEEDLSFIANYSLYLLSSTLSIATP